MVRASRAAASGATGTCGATAAGRAADELASACSAAPRGRGTTTRGAWYYHAYLPEQPDLNWRNPAVQEAMLDVLRFWCARGADGFRIDALRQLVKDDRLRDNPPDPAWREGGDPYDALDPRVHDGPPGGARPGRAACATARRRRSGC